MDEEITKEHLEKNFAAIGDGVSQSTEDSLARLEVLNLQPQQSNHCPINVLQDKDLLRIFTHLSPCDRLIVSEVSKRWYGISRIPWRDVSSLDLTDIPNPNIRPIIQQCPKLKEILALGKRFSPNDLGILARIPLSSLKLYKCASGEVIGDAEVDELWDCNLFPLVFAGSIPMADWEELVLNHFEIPTVNDWFWEERGFAFPVPREPDDECYTFRVTGQPLPASLKRLQLSGIHVTSVRGGPEDHAPGLAYYHFDDFMHLQNLTCLILISGVDERYRLCLFDNFERDLQTLQNLRELFLGSFFYQEELNFDIVALGLPRLEVLFLNNVGSFCDHRPVGNEVDLVSLVTEHPALRILCITGWYPHEHVIPVRRLFPHGYAAKPVPLLHIFLGKMAAEKIVFERSSPDALKVYPITEPLPTFLEKAEIAPIFKGVWIAQQIKDDAKYGTNSIHDPNEGTDDVSVRIVDPE